MKIIINNIFSRTNGYFVDFSTNFGIASASWNGNKPKINKEYFVELEISGVFNWQKDIILTEEHFRIGIENNRLVLVGLLEYVDKTDGYTIIKLGESIIAVETHGEPPALGTNVKLSAKTLILYEVNY